MAEWLFNGVRIEAEPRLLFTTMLSVMPDLQYRSCEALYDFYHQQLELSIEMAEIEKEESKGGRRGSLTRFIASCTRKLQYIPEQRDQLLVSIYNTALSMEGLGFLHGFGFGNKWGDSLIGDSERQTIKEVITGEEKIMATKKKVQEVKENVEMKRSDLSKAAQELNEVLGLDPPIDPKATAEKLTEFLQKAVKMVESGDEFTVETTAVINALKTSETEVLEKEEKPEDGIDLIQTVQDTKKLADLKDLVLKYDAFEKLRKGLDAYQGMQGPRDLKGAMLKVLENEEKVKTTPPKKAGVSGSVSGKTVWGHVATKVSGKIDLILLDKKTHTVPEIAQALDCSESRVAGHITHLEKDKGVAFVRKDDTLHLSVK